MLRGIIIAGEASGDAIGASLMKALRSQSTQRIVFQGVGGDGMRAAGLEQEFCSLDQLSVMGLSDVARRLVSLAKLRAEVVSAIDRARPHFVVFVDSKGFSARVASALGALARRRQEPRPAMFQYVAPSIWAWRTAPWRARSFAALYSAMFLLYPFELPAWSALGVENALYVGSPVLDNEDLMRCRADATCAAVCRADLRQQMGVAPSDRIVCLLPGSRSSEIERHLPLYAEGARAATVEHVVIPAAEAFRAVVPSYEHRLRGLNVNIVRGGGREMGSDLAVATSGTVVLEAAMLRVPTVAAYSTSRLNALAARMLAKVPFATLPNLLLERAAIPELLFNQCTAPNLAHHMRQLLANPELGAHQAAQLDGVLDGLAGPRGANLTPSQTAARHILETVRRAGPLP